MTDVAKAKQARIIQGQIFGRHEVTEQVADIRLLLAPLAVEDVKTVRCLGLNYEQHAIEVFSWKDGKYTNANLRSLRCQFQNTRSYL